MNHVLETKGKFVDHSMKKKSNNSEVSNSNATTTTEVTNIPNFLFSQPIESTISNIYKQIDEDDKKNDEDEWNDKPIKRVNTKRLSNALHDRNYHNAELNTEKNIRSEINGKEGKLISEDVPVRPMLNANLNTNIADSVVENNLEVPIGTIRSEHPTVAIKNKDLNNSPLSSNEYSKSVPLNNADESHDFAYSSTKRNKRDLTSRVDGSNVRTESLVNFQNTHKNTFDEIDADINFPEFIIPSREEAAEEILDHASLTRNKRNADFYAKGKFVITGYEIYK